MNRRLVFTAYNRPVYFEPVLASWANVRGFTDWHPAVHLEPGPIQHTMTDLATRHGLTVTVNPYRRGVLSNPWHALNSAFLAGAEFVVLAEDDVLVCTDTLDYFTWAATEFAADHVLAVCACTKDPHCDPADTNRVQANQWFNPLVWGTWATRWNTVLRDTWDHDYSSGTAHQPQSGWDWNINLRLMNGFTIISPRASRSTHIGKHNGAHMIPADFDESTSPTFVADRPAAAFLR